MSMLLLFRLLNIVAVAVVVKSKLMLLLLLSSALLRVARFKKLIQIMPNPKEEKKVKSTRTFVKTTKQTLHNYHTSELYQIGELSLPMKCAFNRKEILGF